MCPMHQPSRRRARVGWEQELDRWAAPFWAALGDPRRRRWGPPYVAGLLGPGERKSIEPVAERVAPGDYQQLHHFVCTSCWDPIPLEQVLWAKARRLVGGPDAVLIIDDTALIKQGRHSVGVTRQYAGVRGAIANCQVLISLTLARGEVPVGLALRLYLPAVWTDDPARCARAGVPPEFTAPRTKREIALAELDRVLAAGVRFGCVVADADYGGSAEFRNSLSARGLTWAMGIRGSQTVYPADVQLTWPPKSHPGNPRRHPAPSSPRVRVGKLLADARWRRVSWRDGTRGPLRARFTAMRVRVADGPGAACHEVLPGTTAWLVGEWRSTGERKYYLTNHPPRTSLRMLARAIKARWSCEQMHQQLKEELGLDHFEGRSWQGLHHHALLALIGFAFLQHLRLQQARREKNVAAAPSRVATGAESAGRVPPPARTAGAGALAMSAVPRRARLHPVGVDLAE